LHPAHYCRNTPGRETMLNEYNAGGRLMRA
jgi:hypothetical protein